MNKLTIPNGGMPLHGDDFGWMQDGLADAMKGLLHTFAKQHDGYIVLSGVQVQPSIGPGGDPVYQLSEGYVMIDYEVCYFAQQTIQGQNVSIELNSQFDPSGNKVFANSQSLSAYESRFAIAVANPAPVQYLGVDNLPRLTELINESVGAAYQTAVVENFLNNYSNPPTNPLRAYRNIGFKGLNGDVAIGDISRVSFTQITVLDQSYRPLNKVRFAVPIVGVGVNHSAILEITTAGEVQIIAQSEYTDAEVAEYVLVNLSITYF